MTIAFALVLTLIDSREYDPDLIGVIPCAARCREAYDQAVKDRDGLEKAAACSTSFARLTVDLRHEAENVACWWFAACVLRECHVGDLSESRELISRRRWPMPLSWR